MIPGPRPATPLRLLLVGYLLFVSAIWATHEDYGISWDESHYAFTGATFLAHPLDADAVIARVKRAFPSYWEQHLSTHGMFIDALVYLPLSGTGAAVNYDLLHLVKALLFSLTVMVVFFTARRLFGSDWIALLGSLLLVLQPRWLGDIFDNHMDASSTLLYAIELGLAVSIITTPLERRQWPKFMLFAFVASVGFSHRVVLVIVPAVLLLLLPIKFHRHRLRLAGLTGGAAVLFVASLLLVDPYIRHFGPSAIVSKLVVSATLPVDMGKTLFRGEFVSAHDLPWDYLVSWIVITTPLAMLLFFLAGMTLLLLGLRNGADREQRLSWVLLLASILVPIAAVIVMRPVMYDGWRMFLFLAVPIALICGYGLGGLARLKSRYPFGIGLVLLAAQAGVTAHTMFKLYPYHYTYFNQAVGGLRGAYGYYETDYWGKSLKEAAGWLAGRQTTQRSAPYRVAACGNPASTRYYLPGRFVWVQSVDDADYFICYTRFIYQLTAEMRNKAIGDRYETVHMVMRDDIPLSYVKRIGAPFMR